MQVNDLMSDGGGGGGGGGDGGGLGLIERCGGDVETQFKSIVGG